MLNRDKYRATLVLRRSIEQNHHLQYLKVLAREYYQVSS